MTAILVTGITVADFLFQLPELPAAAEKYTADSASIITGGCAANAAIAISRLGGTARLASRVGDDILGTMLLQDFEHQSVDTSMLQRSASARTSFSSIAVDIAGERQIVNFRGSGHSDDASFISADEGAIDAVLVDTRWKTAAHAALTLARQKHVPGVVDAEPPVETPLLMLASHIAFSRAGLLHYTGAPDIDTGLKQVNGKLDAWVCVTDGADGVSFIGDSNVVNIPAFSINAVDTLGAGDIWHGAFALKLGEGANEQEAIVFANAAAAIKCTRPGGGHAAPSLIEVTQLLDSMRS